MTTALYVAGGKVKALTYDPVQQYDEGSNSYVAAMPQEVRQQINQEMDPAQGDGMLTPDMAQYGATPQAALATMYTGQKSVTNQYIADLAGSGTTVDLTDLYKTLMSSQGANFGVTDQGALQALGGKYGGEWRKYFDPALAQQQASYVNGLRDQEQAQLDAMGSGLQNLAVLGGIAAAGIGFASALGGVGAGVDAGINAAAADVGGIVTASAPTGGAFVGTNGLIAGTGNPLVDTALNGAARGALTSTITGRDPVTGALGGAVGAGFASVLPDTGIPAVNAAAGGAVTGGINAAVNGGDVVTGALGGGAAAGTGAFVKDTLPVADTGSNTVTNALAGAAAGGVGAAVAGGNVGTGILAGGVSGAASGAAQDMGAGPIMAGVAGTLAGGLVNGSGSQPDAGTPAATAQQTTTATTGGLGFEVVLPVYRDAGRRDMQWGTRLSGMGG